MEQDHIFFSGEINNARLRSLLLRKKNALHAISLIGGLDECFLATRLMADYFAFVVAVVRSSLKNSLRTSIRRKATTATAVTASQSVMVIGTVDRMFWRNGT